ncbi:MAG: N-acetylmuramoyl-L-alanine amidase [Weeksellaceae bacterium]
MRINHLISLIIIGISISACSSSNKTIKQTKIIKKTIRDTVYVEKAKSLGPNTVLSAVLKDYTVKDDYYPAQGQDDRQKFLIIHYTALANDKSYHVLTNQSVSSHYLVNDKDDKNIDVLVSENKRAWHAGVSAWKGRTNINDSSIGIEIVNPGYSVKNGKKVFYPFPEYQFKKVAALAENIVERYKIDPTYVLAHSDVAPQRKEDPGAFFPWKRLYEEYKIGAWYNEIDKYHFMKQFQPSRKNTRDFILSYQKELSKYGYEVAEDGVWGDQMKRVTMAFQLHFRPSNYSGELDAETWAILKALNKKYRD